MVGARRRKWKIWLATPICLLVVYSVGFYGYAKFQGSNEVRVFPPSVGWHGRQIFYELDTDGTELWMMGSFVYGRWDFPNPPKLAEKPKVEDDGKVFRILFEGKTGSFTQKKSWVRSFQWIPQRKTLAMLVTLDDKASSSEIWTWNIPDGFHRLYRYPRSLSYLKPSLDGKFAWAAEYQPDQGVVFALDGSKQWIVALSSEFMLLDVAMLNEHEFLGPVVILNEGQFLQKWSTVTKRLEKLTIPTGLTSAVVFDGKLWAHRHDGIARRGIEADKVNDIICLDADLKTITQTIPLPRDLEHFESR